MVLFAAVVAFAGAQLSADPRSNGTAEAVAMAVGEKDWKKVEVVSNMIIASDPAQEQTYSMFKMLALLHLDRSRAHAYAKHLTSGLYKRSPEQLSALSEMLLDQDAGPAKPDIELSYGIAHQAMALGSKPNAWALDAMGYAQLFENEPKQALESENLALKSLSVRGTYTEAARSSLKSVVDRHIRTIQAKLTQHKKS